MTRVLTSIGLGTLCYLLTGCAGSGTPDVVAEGPKGLFDVHCARCHAQAGEPGGPPGIGSSKGPNLSRIGKEKGRTVEYFEQFIRNPKSIDPGARLMPAFEGKLTDEEIRSLAEYLAAKK